ncbi:MAG: hypothetical protein LAP40_21220 [Acidobacteriia bacterium]|nr:hypothetical protein [Terriglobia bacterium]
MQFSDFVDQEIVLILPQLHPSKMQRVKLLGVKAGGLWIHSQEITNAVLQRVGKPTAPKTIAVFVPYHAIASGYASIEGPSLDEKAFGV